MVAQHYGINAKSVYSYQDFDRIADNPDITAVYIVLPNSMHAEFTALSAKAGKHVLCEKPMATSVEDGQRMIDACAQAQRKLMIAYRCQYEPFNRTLIRIARGGDLGQVKMIMAGNGQAQGDPRQWRLNKSLAGGGPLPDCGIYCLNAARFITGEEPIEVSGTTYATPGDPRFTSVEESVAFRLRFPSGILAALTCGYSHHEHRTLSLMGTTGWAELDNAFTYRGMRLRTGRADGTAEMISERNLAEKNHFALEMDHFSQCIQENLDPHTGGGEGLQDLRIIHAIYQSAADGGRPVMLPAVDGLDRTRGPAPTNS